MKLKFGNLGPAPRPRLRLQPLPESDLRAGFREAPDSALWRSVLAELDEAILDEVDPACGPTVSSDEMRFYLGGHDALTRFKVKLLAREAEARQTPAQQEEAASQE